MNETDELKPCPFCGSEPNIGSLGGDGENWAIWCPACGCACVETDHETTKEDIIRAWNGRVHSNG